MVLKLQVRDNPPGACQNTHSQLSLQQFWFSRFVVRLINLHIKPEPEVFLTQGIVRTHFKKHCPRTWWGDIADLQRPSSAFPFPGQTIRILKEVYQNSIGEEKHLGTTSYRIISFFFISSFLTSVQK